MNSSATTIRRGVFPSAPNVAAGPTSSGSSTGALATRYMYAENRLTSTIESISEMFPLRGMMKL